MNHRKPIRYPDIFKKHMVLFMVDSVHMFHFNCMYLYNQIVIKTMLHDSSCKSCYFLKIENNNQGSSTNEIDVHVQCRNADMIIIAFYNTCFLIDVSIIYQSESDCHVLI